MINTWREKLWLLRALCISKKNYCHKDSESKPCFRKLNTSFSVNRRVRTFRSQQGVLSFSPSALFYLFLRLSCDSASQPADNSTVRCYLESSDDDESGRRKEKKTSRTTCMGKNWKMEVPTPTSSLFSTSRRRRVLRVIVDTVIEA